MKLTLLPGFFFSYISAMRIRCSICFGCASGARGIGVVKIIGFPVLDGLRCALPFSIKVRKYSISNILWLNPMNHIDS